MSPGIIHCEGVVGDYLNIPLAQELFDELDTRRLLYYRGVGFIGKPQHRDYAVCAFGDELEHAACQMIYLLPVDLVGRNRKRGAATVLCGKGGKRPVVARKTRPAVTQPPLEVVRGYPPVRTQRTGNVVYVSALYGLAYHGERVRKAYLHRYVGVYAYLRDLGAYNRHSAEMRVTFTDFLINLFKYIAGLGVAFPYKDQVGIKEVGYNAAEGYELGVVANTEVPAYLPAGDGFYQGDEAFLSTARRHRGCYHKEMVPLVGPSECFGEVSQGILEVSVGEVAVLPARCRNYEECYVRLVQGPFVVLGGLEPSL